MFKKHLFKGILLILPLLSNAQTDKQYELVADAACTCATKKDLAKLDKNAMSMELGMCMFTALEVLPEKDRKNFDFTNPAKAKGLGEKIGMKMAFKCPKIMLTLGTAMTETESETDKSDKLSGPPPPPPPPPAPAYTVEGKVKEVIEGDYVTILLVDKDGREHKLIWSGHFSGESDFIANPQALKNKNVEISYYLSERYVPKMHDYFSLKNINELIIK